MAKIAKNLKPKPSAWIVSPKEKGRKSVKNGKVFLKNGENFEIELHNPLKKCVLADIKLNGQSISKSGLILKPGQRFYLDCFIDEKKKFIFNTYNVDNSDESLDAISDNGLLEVFFYKEDVVTLDNWKTRFDKIIVERWYPYPYYRDYYYPYNTIMYSSTGNTFNANFPSTTTISNSSLTSGSSTVTNLNSLSSFTSNSLSNSLSKIDDIETGRVEKGKKSLQQFTELEMDFEKNYISSTIIQILPDSRKPIETKDLVDNSSSNKLELTKVLVTLSDLHKQGILTDDEFNTKKAEILSRI